MWLKGNREAISLPGASADAGLHGVVVFRVDAFKAALCRCPAGPSGRDWKDDV